MQDDAGDENFHLFAIDATSPSSVARDLTPYKGAKAQNVITNKRFPDQLLVGINNRNPACFDMYRCDVASGKLTLDTENPGDVLGWGTEDESFEVRARACADGRGMCKMLSCLHAVRTVSY